jgi:hypothetical protein
VIPPVTLVLTALVAAPVGGLASPSYRAREIAEARLGRALPLAPGVAVAAAETHPDREVRERAGKVVRAWGGAPPQGQAEQARPTTWPRMVWIDMMPANFPGRWEMVSELLAEARRQGTRDTGPPEWEDYRAATILLCERLYAEGWSEQRVTEFLNEMGQIEQQWIEDNKGRYGGLKQPERGPGA